MTHSCGHCGGVVTASDVTCPHCHALLAAWAHLPDAVETVSHVTPEYARPPMETNPTHYDDAESATGTWEIEDPVGEVVHYREMVSAAEKEAVSRLVNIISSYAHTREVQENLARGSAPTAGSIGNEANNSRPLRHRQSESTGSNLVIGIGVAFAVVLVLMWGIVATMVVTEMVSLEFVVTTVILTLAFKPTFSHIRRAL